MELTQTFKAKIDGKTLDVKAIWITDPTEVKGGRYMVTSSEVLRLLTMIKHTLIISNAVIEGGVAKVAVMGDFPAYGSAVVGEGYDPIGVAMRRAVNNYAFMTGEFNDVFDQLRELNGGTLDPKKSDELNNSVEKYLM